MITQEELDEFVKEFDKEDPALVNEALEECIKLHGRSMWNSASTALQINSLWCWIAGLKKRNGALFVIKENGWSGKWEAGEAMELDMTEHQLGIKKLTAFTNGLTQIGIVFDEAGDSVDFNLWNVDRCGAPSGTNSLTEADVMEIVAIAQEAGNKIKQKIMDLNKSVAEGC